MVTVPDGHVDDDPPATLGSMTPALPSRATGEAKPLTPLPQAVRPPRKRAEPKKPPKRVANPRRAKPAPKPKRNSPVKKRARRAPAAPKNRNRPLEAKNRLHAVMTVVAGMSKMEVTTFMGAMSMLEDMSGPARRKVIEALGSVYA